MLQFSGIRLLIYGIIFLGACSSQASVFRNVEDLRSRTPESLSAEERLELEMADLFAKTERYVSFDQFDKALSLVQTVISEHPNTVYSDKAYYMRGTIFTHMLNFHRDLDKAAAAFRMVIASDPVSVFDTRAHEALNRITK